MKLDGGRFGIVDYKLEQTRILVESKGIEVKLIRGAEWEDDGAGGVIKPDNQNAVDVPVQTFFFSDYDDAERLVRSPPTGELRVNRYVLVGLPDADMEARDTFEIGDETYEIEYVNTEDAWQKLGEVTRLGDQREG